ncbi:lysoplasmalogenase [Escherichia sp. TWPC-MK]
MNSLFFRKRNAYGLSAWLSVDASYRGPTWQRWVFKPLTLLLLLLLAWQAPMFDAISYLVLAGLCASLLGDALTLLPRQRLMYAIGAFFLSHLLYTIYFASQMTLSFFWPLPLVLLVLGALLLARSHRYLPAPPAIVRSSLAAW